MTGRIVSSLLLAAAPVAWAAAQPSAGSLETLFPRQAPLAVEGEGLAMLLLPPEVLAECRSDLSDVRIVDAAGEEVPYLVDSGRLPSEGVRSVTTIDVEVLDVVRATREREDAPDLQREVYRLGLPGAWSGEGEWELVVTVGRTRYTRRVTVAQGDETLVADGSIFSLPGQGASRNRIALPALGREDLVVRIEGEEGFFLEPVFRLESGRDLAGRERVRVELGVAEARRLERRSELVVERPAGVVPDRLELDTSTPVFSREVEVWDEGAGSGVSAVGSGRIFRVEAGVVEGLEIELGAVRGDRLRILVDDGDSPPLEDVTITAAIRQPALVFAGAAGQRLLFGGGRAHRPRYDLAALRPGLPAAGEAARVGERIYDPQRLVAARLGEVAANPRFDPAPALAFAMHPGGALDRRRYTHRQLVRATPSSEGLVSADVGLDLQAVARADLADVRVVDGAGRQWAYLVERRAAAVTRELDLSGPRTRDGVSRYALGLPASPSAIERIVLHTEVPYFDRPFELEAEPEGGGETRVVARGRLARPRDDPRPLRIDVGGGRVTSLELVVPDGDDAPLELERAEGRFGVPRLYFAAPAGEYALLAGNPDDTAPVYELARVRDVVLAVDAGSAEPEPLERNPEFSTAARLARGSGLQTALLWGAIVLAVAVLGWMTLRLARRQEP